MNVKFHKNCENTGKILKIVCVRCHFVKFEIVTMRSLTRAHSCKRPALVTTTFSNF